MNRIFLFTLTCIWLPIASLSAQILSPRNPEAPFPYLVGATRTWPILEDPLPPHTKVQFIARSDDQILAEGESLDFQGLKISFTPEGLLQVTDHASENPVSFRLEIQLSLPDGSSESQTIGLRPAPPDRPISYYADLVDDIIRIFSHPTTGEFSPVSKSGFDQYFRRLQAHGTRRLIVWLSPFPYIADPQNYSPDDWDRHARQATAIIEHKPLNEAYEKSNGLKSWQWLSYLMELRLTSEFGRMFGESARQHGISLTVSYRPFEAALTKYYELPTFDHAGNYLWGFLPLASPTTNYHPDQVSWKHYREILKEIGNSDSARLTSIELTGLESTSFNPDGLRLSFSQFPPIADDAYVLSRDLEDNFQLVTYSTIREKVEQALIHRDHLTVEQTPGGLRITNLEIPPETRYLILSWQGAGEGPTLSALTPVRLFAAAGNQLGRETTYWVHAEANDVSRIAPITQNGEFRSEFNSSEESHKIIAAGPERISLANRQVVIDLGSSSTVEILDFNQPLTRQNAIRELQTILNTPGFDEILINTRSHVDLPLSMGDGPRGIQSAGSYWHSGPGMQHHLGLDRAYVPRSDSSLQILRDLAKTPEGIETITTWKSGEWDGPCQTPAGPPFRYARNRGTADGLRFLFEDLERTFPKHRIRAVIPQSEETVRRIYAGLDTLEQPTGGPYGRDYYRRLWTSNNHIPSVGEGMAMVDLTVLSIEPVFLGSGGYIDDSPPFELHVRESILGLANNLASSFHGPRSYFFEAQFSLRHSDPEQLVKARATRERMICHLLNQQSEINEVILYEAADWLYMMDLNDPDLVGHHFLDKCGQ